MYTGTYIPVCMNLAGRRDLPPPPPHVSAFLHLQLTSWFPAKIPEYEQCTNHNTGSTTLPLPVVLFLLHITHVPRRGLIKHFVD